MKVRAWHALLAALPVAAGGVLGAGTLRAAAYGERDGVNGSDIVADDAADAACVILERETLTFYIDDLPASADAAKESTSRVSAEYTLYNPTAEDLPLRLYLPVGSSPAYLDGVSSARYTVTAEGEDLRLTARHTYQERNYFGAAFDLDGERPRDERRQDTFFGEEVSVTIYTYTVSVPAGGGDTRTFIFCYDANPRRTQIFSAENGALGVSNGSGELYMNVASGKTQQVVVYAVGDVPDGVSADVYSMAGAEARPVQGAEVALSSAESTTFGALVDGMYAALPQTTRGVLSSVDFYNAAVAMLEGGEQAGLTSRADATAVLENLMLWYEYELTLPAGARVTHTVTAPLYPDLPEEGGERWTYHYLLSPGQQWKDFGGIEIRVVTPYHIENGSLEFTADEGGFVYVKEGLPLGELVLTVTPSQTAPTDPDTYGDQPPTLVTALIILGVTVGIAAVVLAIVVLARRRANKRARAEEEKCRGGTTEGKVDIDPFPELGGENGEKEENGKKDEKDENGKKDENDGRSD